MLKKTIWIIGGFGGVALLLGAVALFSGGKDKTVITTEIVRRGDLVQTVEVTGEAASLEDIDLAFTSTGTIASLPYEMGDRVTAGTTIATLAAGELRADVARAQALLDQQLAGATDEEIAVSAAQVAVAEAARLSAEADLENKKVDVLQVTAQSAASVTAASLAADKAQDDLTRTLTENSLKIAQAREDYSISLEGVMVTIRGALADADQVLGRENALQNNDCEHALGRQDPTTVSAANFAFDAARTARDVGEQAVYALSTLSTDAELTSAQLLAEDALEKTVSTLYHVARVLDATAADSVSCAIADINAYKTTIKTARDAVQSEGAAVTNSKQTYDLAQANAQTSELAAQNTLKATTQDFFAAQISEENDIARAQAAVTIAEATVIARQADVASAQAQLAQVKASPRAVDLASLRADLAAAQARYAKSLMVSPISGVITHLAVDVGEQAAAGAVIATVHADAGQFKISTDISESDIAKVSVGDEASVVFDAFGDDRVFAATVASLNPAEKLIEGVVYYEATIVLIGSEAREDIRSGMSADITIVTGESSDALYVSQRTVLEEHGMKYVRIPTGNAGDFEKRTVIVGMRADDGYVEVVSGVEEGEVVIVSVKEK